jgi:hypothetical protein
MNFMQPLHRHALLSVCLAATLIGCATTTGRVAVDVDAYRGPRASFLTDSFSVGVLQNTYATNPLFAVEVQRKIELLLCARGLRVTSPDSADFVIYNVFGIDDPSTQSTGGVVVPLQGMVVYRPTSVTTFTRWMGIGLAPAIAMQYPASFQDGSAWAWVSTGTSTGSSGDLRHIVDYLLVALLNSFPSGTAQRLRYDIGLDDNRILALRQQLAQPSAGQPHRCPIQAASGRP